MRYLARLLADPEREFHVLDLVAAEATRAGLTEPGPRGARAALGDAGEMLDAQAKEAYRRRLAEIDEDIDDARASGDEVREAQADLERDFLVRELSRAVGLGGRDRRAGSASERARVGGDARGAPGDGPHRRAAPRARRAPRPDHPHRHVLLLPAGPARPRGLGRLSEGTLSPRRPTRPAGRAVGAGSSCSMSSTTATSVPPPEAERLSLAVRQSLGVAAIVMVTTAASSAARPPW